MTDVWEIEAQPTRRGLFVDAAVGGGFAVVMGGLHLALGVVPAVAGVLLGLALVVRRRSWVLMSAAGFAAALIQVLTGDIAYLADGVYAVLFFSLGGHRRAAVRRFGLAAGVVAALVAGAFAAWIDPGFDRDVVGRVVVGVSFTAITAVVVLGGWVAGFVRWQNRQAVQARVDARIEAIERRRVSELYDIEQERRRIAADMHDVVAHSWAVVAAQGDGARYALERDPASAGRALEVISETARAAMTDLRTIVGQLRDPALQPSTPGFEQQTELFARMRASGMTLVDTESGDREASPFVALTAHRLLSESLTNALKHGDLAAPVRVEQDWRHGYRLTVTSRLRPATPSVDAGTTTIDRRGADGPGHGLLGMTERANVAGGTLTAGPDGRDWIVRAHIPSATTTSGHVPGELG